MNWKIYILFFLTSRNSIGDEAYTETLTYYIKYRILGSKGRPARKADYLTAICEPIVYKIWNPERLTTLWASVACYRDSFTFTIRYRIQLFWVRTTWRTMEVTFYEILTRSRQMMSLCHLSLGTNWTGGWVHSEWVNLAPAVANNFWLRCLGLTCTLYGHKENPCGYCYSTACAEILSLYVTHSPAQQN
jgi:hypothetical protein